MRFAPGTCFKFSDLSEVSIKQAYEMNGEKTRFIHVSWYPLSAETFARFSRNSPTGLNSAQFKPSGGFLKKRANGSNVPMAQTTRVSQGFKIVFSDH